MSKMLYIVDSYNWALANRARSLKKNLPSHSVTIKYFRDLERINFDNFNIVYVLNWPIHGYIKSKIKQKRKYRLVTSISSHIGRPPAKKMEPILKNYDRISTSSKMLFNEFSPIFKKNIFYTPFGVEENLFKPISKPSALKNIFGWVGNNNRPVKRFNEINNVFKSLGSKYMLKTAINGHSRKQMVDFYNKVGTVICFSSSEGTPNPILEASSCGRSIISTGVGNVPELIGRNKSIQIVRTSGELKSAIIRNARSGQIINEEGQFLREQIIKNWTWEKQIKSFLLFLGLKHG